MDHREEETGTELCVLCGEEVDLMDPSAHARVKGRTICRSCSLRLGGAYNPEEEAWTHRPDLPEALGPHRD